MLLFFSIPSGVKTLLIALVTGLVLVGVMLRPWKTNEAMIALAGDATALILTPILYSLTTRLRLPVLLYLFACTFTARSGILKV